MQFWNIIYFLTKIIIEIKIKNEPNHIKLFSFFSGIGYKAYSNLSFQKEIIFRDKKSNSLTRSTYKVKNLAPQNL